MHPNSHSDPGQPAQNRISVRGPAALVAALPYLMDIPLAGTIVLAVIDEDSTLGWTAHRAMPPRPEAASQEVLQHWAAVIGGDVAAGVSALALRSTERLAIVLFMPSDCGAPPPWFGRAVLARSLPLPMGLLDVVAVFEGRWLSLVCSEEGCCPAEGQLILHNSEATLVAAELVAAGLSVVTEEQAAESGRARAAQRAQVAAVLQAMPYPGTITARRTLLRQVWPAVRATPTDLPVPVSAAMAMAADRPGVRDALLIRMARAGNKDLQFWARQQPLWRDLLGCVPAQWGAGPACLLAVAAWACGEPTTAVQAADEALALQQGHRMAELVRRLVLQGTPPQEWFERMSRISEADCLRFDRPRPALHASTEAAG